VSARIAAGRSESYGERGLSPVDRLGVALSMRAVLRSAPLSARPRVLDLGCGYDATLLRALSPRIASGTGVDLSVSTAAKAVGNLNFIEAPIEDALPTVENASREVILLISVLEHLDDPLWTLAECRRVLPIGGVLLVNVPTWTGKTLLELSAFRLGLSPECEMDDHRMYYGRRDLWPLLVKAGFRPSRIRLGYHKLGLNLFARATAS
jgi:SAM-dependent methyltransferase